MDYNYHYSRHCPVRQPNGLSASSEAGRSVDYVIKWYPWYWSCRKLYCHENSYNCLSECSS